jgi:hypothetical protein
MDPTNMMILAIIAQALALSREMENRCKQYGIRMEDCMNSTYVPRKEYDDYLRSFHMPVIRDAECARGKCVAIVHRNANPCRSCRGRECPEGCAATIDSRMNPMQDLGYYDDYMSGTRGMGGSPQIRHIIHHYEDDKGKKEEKEREKEKEKEKKKEKEEKEKKEKEKEKGECGCKTKPCDECRESKKSKSVAISIVTVSAAPPSITNETIYKTTTETVSRTTTVTDASSRAAPRELVPRDVVLRDAVPREAMPRGAPLIAEDDGGIPEIPASVRMPRDRAGGRMQQETDQGKGFMPRDHERRAGPASSATEIVTVTRVMYRTTSVEQPITLYREVTTTVERSVPIINYKVTTFTEISTLVRTVEKPITISVERPAKTQSAGAAREEKHRRPADGVKGRRKREEDEDGTSEPSGDYDYERHHRGREYYRKEHKKEKKCDKEEKKCGREEKKCDKEEKKCGREEKKCDKEADDKKPDDKKPGDKKPDDSAEKTKVEKSVVTVTTERTVTASPEQPPSTSSAADQAATVPPSVKAGAIVSCTTNCSTIAAMTQPTTLTKYITETRTIEQPVTETKIIEQPATAIPPPIPQMIPAQSIPQMVSVHSIAPVPVQPIRRPAPARAEAAELTPLIKSILLESLSEPLREPPKPEERLQEMEAPARTVTRVVTTTVTAKPGQREKHRTVYNTIYSYKKKPPCRRKKGKAVDKHCENPEEEVTTTIYV